MNTERMVFPDFACIVRIQQQTVSFAVLAWQKDEPRWTDGTFEHVVKNFGISRLEYLLHVRGLWHV